MVTKTNRRRPFVPAHPAKSTSKTSTSSATKASAISDSRKKWLLYGSLGVAAAAAIFGGSKLPFFSKVAAPYVAKVASKGFAAASGVFA